MSLIEELMLRSESTCELCGATDNLTSYEVQPTSKAGIDENVLVCDACREQIENPDMVDVNHWRCLNESMWSQVPAVQVVIWRMLNRLSSEGWPSDLLDMMYLEDETLTWAKKGIVEDAPNDSVVHLDSNGTVLKDGDTVVLIKDLNVKGAGFTAKRGTSVRNILLVEENPEHIEGRVEGQMIVILSKFVKKN